MGTNAHTRAANVLTVICKLWNETRIAIICGYNMLAATQYDFRWEAVLIQMLL